MYVMVAQIAAASVEPDDAHQACACRGLVVTLPDGRLQLYAEDLAELEALGWGILDAVERLRGVPRHGASEAAGATRNGLAAERGG